MEEEKKSAKDIASSINKNLKELSKKGIDTVQNTLKTNNIDIGKILKSPLTSTKFLIVYLVCMIPTYLVRYAAISAGIEDIFKRGGTAKGIGFVANLILLSCLLALCYISYLRGKFINKQYLTAFPIVATIFDFFLVFIPLVPTVMHVVTLIIGIPEPKKEQGSDKNQENKETQSYDELEKLASLKEKGLITDEEFEAEKKKILNNQ